MYFFIIIIIYSFRVFHISVSWWFFTGVWVTVSLRILAVLSNAVIWIVSTHLPTSKSSRPFNNPWVVVPKAPITIGTIITFMFHSFFNSLARSRYLSFFWHSFTFILWSAGTAKLTILQILFFWLIIIRSGLLARIRWLLLLLLFTYWLFLSIQTSGFHSRSNSSKFTKYSSWFLSMLLLDWFQFSSEFQIFLILLQLF